MSIEFIYPGCCYADDLVLTAESLEQSKEKFLKWKEGMKSKELTANVEITKIMISGAGESPLVISGPVQYARQGVRSNSLMCTMSGGLVHDV